MAAVCAACGAPSTDDLSTCPNCGVESAPSSVKAGIQSIPRQQGRIPENMASALAYVTVIPAIVLMMTKPYKSNAFIRFHALQSVGIAIASVALGIILLLLSGISAINLLLIPLSFIAGIGIALLVCVCMIKAFQGETHKLPLLGNWAEKQAFRS